MNWVSYGYGVGLCAVMAVTAIFISSYIPIGSVTIAIILGIIIGNGARLNKALETGINYSGKQILSVAIALMGVKLNFQILKELGLKSILLVIVALVVTIFTSIILSEIFKFDKKFALLLGIGNGVCGSSAIAATEQIIGANEEEVGLSVAIVNFLGTIGIFIVPFIATILLKFSDLKSGILVGNTLQAVGQVVAAGFSISDSAGQISTIIKMTRILMLFPLIIILIPTFAKQNKLEKSKIKKPKIPLFIIGFVLFSLLATFNVLPKNQIKILGTISNYLLVVAMTGIGLKITIKSILKDGKKSLTIGGSIFMTQILFSSTMVWLFY